MCFLMVLCEIHLPTLWFDLWTQKKNLNIKGLMCIPPNDLQPEKYFLELKILREKIDSNLLLSMGMSQDYDIALKFDSNIIRVGSKIFSWNILFLS